MTSEKGEKFVVYKDKAGCNDKKKSILDMAEVARIILAHPTLTFENYAYVMGMLPHIMNDNVMGGTDFYAGVLGNLTIEGDAKNEPIIEWIKNNIKRVILLSARSGSCSVYLTKDGPVIDPAVAYRDQKGFTVVKGGDGIKTLQSRVTLILNPVIIKDESVKIKGDTLTGGLPLYMGGLLSFVRSDLLSKSSIEAKAELSKVRFVAYNDGMAGNPEAIGGLLEDASNSSSRQIETKDGAVYSISGSRDDIEVIDSKIVDAPTKDASYYMSQGMISGPVPLQVAGGSVTGINRDILEDLISSTVSKISSDWPMIIEFCQQIISVWQDLQGVSGDVKIRRTLHRSEYNAVGKLLERLSDTVFTVNELRGIAGQMLGLEFPDLDEDENRT